MGIMLRRALGWLFLLGSLCFLAIVLPGLLGISQPVPEGHAFNARADPHDLSEGMLLSLWFASFTWAGYRIAKYGSVTWPLSFIGFLLYLCAVLVMFNGVPHLVYQGTWWPLAGLWYLFYLVPALQGIDVFAAIERHEPAPYPAEP